MKRRAVKITGIGPVTPAGIGRESFWKGIVEPVSRVRPFRRVDETHGPLVAAYLDDFEITRFVDRPSLPKGAARHTLFAIAGAHLALADAGLTAADLRGMNCAIVTGTTLFDFAEISRSILSVAKHGLRGSRGRGIYTSSSASVPGSIAETLRVKADTMVLQTSCAAGLDSIGYAANRIATGQVDVAICGGTDAPLYQHPLLELRAAGLTPPTDEMPERLARPFDMWRTTGVVSEGACFFVLEADESPRAGYSRIRGYAYSNDQNGDLCGGLRDACRRALADARLRPGDLDAVSAWGPGHRLIDVAEARAMRDLLGEDTMRIPFTSIKGAIGSPLSAAGPIQVAAVALGQQNELLTPTVNWQFPDPECPLALSRDARRIDHRVTMVNAHGLAGMNSCMILERC